MTSKWKRANKTETTNEWKQRFDWFIERIQTRMAFGWLSEHSGEKNFNPENFLEINRYFALTLYCNTISQSSYAFSILGFLWRENEEAMFWSFHPLADESNNEHGSRSYENHSINREKYMCERHKRRDAWANFTARLRGLFHSPTDG